jgi:hypothetical protein
MLASRLQNSECVRLSSPAGRAAARAQQRHAPGPCSTKPGPSSPTWRSTAASACRPTARSRPAARPARRARAALPVHAAQHRRRELRHRGEADQADADQRVGLAGQVEIDVAQQQDADDGARRMPSSRPVRSPPARAPKRRVRSSSGITRSLQTMVDTAMASTITMPVAADSPPMKASQRQRACCPCGQRQRQHEGLGIHARAEVQQPAERDRAARRG